MTSKPLVLVLGITGNTGSVIAQSLLDSGSFRVAALVRPSSISKPAVEAFRAKGVEIREGDINDAPEQLKEYLAGVDILLSTVRADVILQQKAILQAAKNAGVKRVVPCDFGTLGAKGVRLLHDQKLEIREFVKSLSVQYTFIDIGLWMQLTVTLPADYPPLLRKMTLEVPGGGNKKLLLTDLNHVGKFVAKILDDQRTVNQLVNVWEDELTWSEAKAICEKFSGEKPEDRIHLSGEDLLKRAAEAEADYLKTGNDDSRRARSLTEYQYSMHILGENSLANAKKLGYLDARELYPEIPVASFEKFAETFYANPEPYWEE